MADSLSPLTLLAQWDTKLEFYLTWPGIFFVKLDFIWISCVVARFSNHLVFVTVTAVIKFIGLSAYQSTLANAVLCRTLWLCVIKCAVWFIHDSYSFHSKWYRTSKTGRIKCLIDFLFMTCFMCAKNILQQNTKCLRGNDVLLTLRFCFMCTKRI